MYLARRCSEDAVKTNRVRTVIADRPPHTTFLLPTNTLKREESAEREKFGEWVLSHRLPCASVVLRLEKEEVQDRERLA